jgi:hypothetical protein
VKQATALIVVVTHADGRRQRLRVEATSARVGSAAHCEVRLPIDQAAGEHVLLLRQGDGVMAQARCSEPAPTIDGTPFTSARLPSSAVLALAETRIVVSVAEQERGTSIASIFRRSAAWLVAGLVAAAAVVGFGRSGLGVDGTAAAEVPNPPPLWTAPQKTCRSKSESDADQRAEQLVAQAHAKRLRGAFAPADAVDAVSLYENAAACFRRAGRSHLAHRAELRATELRRRTADRYRARQLRLSLALEAQDWRAIDREVRSLTAMLGPGDGAYRRWLAALHRRAGLHADEEE